MTIWRAISFRPVRTMLALFSSHTRAHCLENVEAFNRQTFALFRAYLESRSDELRTLDLGLATFVCVRR